MLASRPWWRSALAAGLMALAIAGCAPQRPASTPGPASTVPSAPTTAPSVAVSYAPGASPTVTMTAVPGEQTYAPTGAPAPTQAGPLEAKSLPNPILGFTGVAKEAAEGEYNANGTWVHALEGAQASVQALPLCGGGVAPQAAYALAGTYNGPKGEPGNALALEFADEEQAKRWLGVFTQRLKVCDKRQIEVRDLNVASDSFTGRRRIATDAITWSEAGQVSGKRVLLIALAGEGLDLDAMASALR